MKNTGGFTLMEAVLATILLTLPIIGMLALFTHSISSSESQQPFNTAQYAAEQKMEEIISLDYTNTTLGGILELYTNDGVKKETTFDPNGEDDNLNGVLDSGEDENENGSLDSPFDGSGTVYAEELAGITDPLNRLMRVKVVVCCQKQNAVIGEDADGDGEWDAGEDTIPASAGGVDGELDSPCQLETVIVNRSY